MTHRFGILVSALCLRVNFLVKMPDLYIAGNYP